MKKAIVIGGTSGIGKGLAEILLKNNYIVAITGRRGHLLNELKSNFKEKVITLQHDVTETLSSDNKLNFIFEKLKSVDLVIVSSGFSELNQKLNWEIESKTIQTNVNGIAKVYQFVFQKFRQQGYGHLVGISSIAAVRGNRHSPSYSASKAFQANYLESLRFIAKNEKLDIDITDVQPGFVNTPMAKGESLFWVASVNKASKQIFNAIKRNKKKVYVTKRWALIAFLMKIMPSWLMEKF